MLEITHTYTPQTTKYTLRMEQPLMMVMTLNCKYYKKYYLLLKYLKLMHNYKLSASNAHLLSNASVLL